MKAFDVHYLKMNRKQVSNTTDYFNELMAQFYLDCNAEDLKENSEAKKCFRYLKSLGRKLKIVNCIEKQLFGI